MDHQPNDTALKDNYPTNVGEPMDHQPNGTDPKDNNLTFVKEFLMEEARESTCSRSSLRMELARAQNKRERIHQNMKKTKERMKKQMEKLRELESSYNLVQEEIRYIRNQLGNDD